MNAKISVFVICVKVISYLLLYNLKDYIFNVLCYITSREKSLNRSKVKFLWFENLNKQIKRWDHPRKLRRSTVGSPGQYLEQSMAIAIDQSPQKDNTGDKEQKAVFFIVYPSDAQFSFVRPCFAYSIRPAKNRGR